MPPKRNNKKKRTKPVATKKVDIVQDKRLDNISKRLKAVEGQKEVKVHDEYSGVSSVTTTGLFHTPLSPILQGVTDSTRIGDEIFVKKWKMDMKLLANTGQASPTNVRMICFIDKQYDGLPPDVYTGAGVFPYALLDNSIITDGVLAPYNMDTIEFRFKILSDKIYHFDPKMALTITTVGALQTITTVVPVQKQFKKSIALNRRFRFVAGSGGTTDLIGPQPLMLMIGDASAFPPAVAIGARVTFTDS